MTPGISWRGVNMRTAFAELIREALLSGATEAAIVAAKKIVVDQQLADRCRQPRCENYGLSRNCPPHIGGPAAFGKLLEEYDRALFFKIDVPAGLLYSSDNRELFQLLHEIAAGIEQVAVTRGFLRARAFAGESCKKIFCHDQPGCIALAPGGMCRNPQYARPSMSGFGINVAELVKLAGWAAGVGTSAAESRKTDTAYIYGLVLLH